MKFSELWLRGGLTRQLIAMANQITMAGTEVERR